MQESTVRGTRMGTLLLLLLTLMAWPAAAAPPVGADELQRLVQEGAAETLEARLRDDTAENRGLIAQAWANRSRRARTPEERRKAFEKADEKHQQWIAALKRQARLGSPTAIVRLAAGRVSYGGMILAVRIAPELDEYELTLGRRGDRAALVRYFELAHEQYENAVREVSPILERLGQYEEELLAVGLYDALQESNFDARLNLGWCRYYLAVLGERDSVTKLERLLAAERIFQDLVDLGLTGPARYLCYLGLAMAQREQERFKEALASFRNALDDNAGPVLTSRVRYELARCQLAAGQFDEARATLRPLVEKDPQRLREADEPGRFYINLAHLWDAYSYLLEAERVRQQAKLGGSVKALLQKARRLREEGLARFKRLADRGGPWPALAQVYVLASIDLTTPLGELDPLDLLFAAQYLMEQRRYSDALERLQEAAGRQEIGAAARGDVLFELGRCQYQLGNLRAAAETFGRLAAEHRDHARASQAATFAYQLWGKVAESSRQAEDYLQLAATLRNLLQSYADHPDREQALWLLPTALLWAGQFEQAAEHFGKVPPTSSRWEEAQFRRAACAWKAVEARQSSLPAAEYRAGATRAAAELVRYADQALERSHTTTQPDAVRQWSAEARLTAAEILLSAGVEEYTSALHALRDFEAQYPATELLGRVLAARMRAYRGLRQFDRAAAMLREFLSRAPAGEVGHTLVALARGMQEEVERLQAAGRSDAARQLASDAVGIFDELEKWMRGEPGRAGEIDRVIFGKAQMLHLARRDEEALPLVDALLARNPKDGNCQYLRALILTSRLPADAGPDAIQQVQDAWAALLTDPAIRRRAPERFWEARYHWLSMLLRLGRAAEVEHAITQEQIWTPELGGPPWREKFEDLRRAARRARGLPPDTAPASQAVGAGESAGHTG